MIKHIRIKNFAIIAEADIDFHDGLNIITGETGAGKSIVIEAVSLALGSRADTAFVRSGEDKATVQMIADDAAGKEYILTREVSTSGRNICRINGDIVTLGELSHLCSRLADIHGQYDHQSLLDPANHIRLLDTAGSHTITPEREQVAGLYQAYAEIASRLHALRTQAAEDARQRDFMAFELQELQDAQLVSGEDDELETEIALLQNSEAIYGNLSGAYAQLSEHEYALLPALKQAADQLSEIDRFSPELSTLSERLGECYYELEDIAGELRRSRDRVSFDPQKLDQCITRADQLNRLKQKHGRTIDGLISYREELAARLENIDNSQADQTALEAQLHEARTALSEACGRLSHARKDAARLLEQQISRELSQLQFADTRFQVSFQKAAHFSAEGNDIVEFLISTNRGEDLKPLSKIASGGEMSRIMLAFKKIISDYDEIPTMIFDEIDAGISGVAASVVGRKLCEIARHHQIICITHLPQIAAFGAHHYRIQKSSDDKMTYTTVMPLSPGEKVVEVARLLGGANVTEITLQSARELIEASQG